MSPKDEFIKKIGSRVEDGEVLLGLLFENLHLQTIIQTVCSEARPKYIGFSPKDLMLRFTEELVSGGSSGLDWLFSRDEAAFASLFKCLKEIREIVVSGEFNKVVQVRQDWYMEDPRMTRQAFIDELRHYLKRDKTSEDTRDPSKSRAITGFAPSPQGET